MNTGNFLIENKDLELAKTISRFIENDDLRNKIIANGLAISVAKKYFKDFNKNIDSETGLYNIPEIVQKFDIVDLYINNNYLDIRIFFDEDELFVPKVHFAANILPIAYMFIKLSSDLSEASVAGFISPTEIDTTNNIGDFYQINQNNLKTYQEIENIFKLSDEISIVSDEKIFAFIEKELNSVDDFIKDLIHSENARIKLAKAIKAQTIFNFVSVPKIENTPIAINNDAEELNIDNFENLLQSNEDFELLEENFENDDFALLPQVDVSNEIDDNFTSLDISEDADSLSEFGSVEIESLEESIPEINSSQEECTNTLEEEHEISLSFNDNNQTMGTIFDEFQEEEELDSSSLILEEDFEDIVKNNSKNIIEEAPISDSIDNIQEEINEIDLNNDNENILKENNDAIEESSQNELGFIDNNLEEGPKELEITDLEEDKEEVITDTEALLESDLEESVENFEIQKHEELSSNGYEEDVDTLFNNEEEMIIHAPSNGGGFAKIIAFASVLAILGGAGYCGYNKYMSTHSIVPEYTPKQNLQTNHEPISTAKQPDAMPEESVEAPIVDSSTQNLGITETIPAIEQNLDASILVSNLKVDWEVPAGYTTNASVKRYLVKLGKIIQLNLKSELLLLNRPPITNIISVEISYNASSRKFETVGIIKSSGEKTIDDLILATVRQALDMHLNMNSDSFASLKGNPVLVIRL